MYGKFLMVLLCGTLVTSLEAWNGTYGLEIIGASCTDKNLKNAPVFMYANQGGVCPSGLTSEQCILYFQIAQPYCGNAYYACQSNYGSAPDGVQFNFNTLEDPVCLLVRERSTNKPVFAMTAICQMPKGWSCSNVKLSSNNYNGVYGIPYTYDHKTGKPGQPIVNPQNPPFGWCNGTACSQPDESSYWANGGSNQVSDIINEITNQASNFIKF